MDIESFQKEIQTGYTCTGEYFTLGAAMLNQAVVAETHINIPLSTLNRHGLIAGATGTGKTKTIQLLAEQLSSKGVSVLLMDLKGDLSGLAVAGEENEHITERHTKIGLPHTAQKFPVELLSLSAEPGVHLRTTVSELGSVLLSKMLALNSTQASIIALIFKYCRDQNLPLLDLSDLKKILSFATKEGKTELEENYGRISSTSVSTILRKVIELEEQGAGRFFGEPSFEIEDLLHKDAEGRASISILRLVDLQDRPKLFSTFMLSLLAEVYSKLPEAGDIPKPKLAIFIDEAHLLFNEATDELLAKLESMAKLIRSKGVGLFFCTQNPSDIPDAILGQLGLKIQHALRAFTAKDRKAIKLTAENYPISEFYKTDELLTSLGIGEAAVTVLSEKGRPTPLAATLLCAPQSRMGPLDQNEIAAIVQASSLVNKYNQTVNRDSAYEMLTQRTQTKEPAFEENEAVSISKARTGKKPVSTLEKLSKNTMVRQLVRQIVAAIIAAIGIGRRRR